MGPSLAQPFGSANGWPYKGGLSVMLLLCNAVACPHLERSGMGTACSRLASAHLYHAGSRLLPCDGAAD